MPKHNPTAVFIFDIDGTVLFKNSSAHEELINIHSTLDIPINNHEAIINQNKSDTIMFESNNRFYQANIKGVKKEKFLLAYISDVIEVMELNDAIQETQREVIYAMGEIGESRSKETGNHVKRVALYSKELALLCGLSFEEANRLQMASPCTILTKLLYQMPY